MTRISLDVLCATHPDEELSQDVYAQLHERQFPGVRTRIAHPEAVAAGNRRYVGTSQIMAHYPGDPTGDPEDRAAAANMVWLGQHVGDATTIVCDIHSNPSGLNYAEVGLRASRAAIAGAFLLGYDTCTVSAGSFYTAVPNALTLETSVQTRAEQGRISTKLARQIGSLATCTMNQLEDVSVEAITRMRFMQKYEVAITRSIHGAQLLHVDESNIEELEAIPVQPPFSSLALPDHLRTALGLPLRAELYMKSWGYRGAGPVLEGQMTADGCQRKACIGSICVAVTPAPNGQWVNFER